MPASKREGFRDLLDRLSQRWISQGLPSRETIERQANQLADWKVEHEVSGIWFDPPRMITATLDDGMGHGLALIERFAAVMGMQVNPLGLLQKPKTILSACQEMGPDLLGVTVLHPDSDNALAVIGHNLPPATALIAGGPAFDYDPEMAHRCAVNYVAVNLAYFIDFGLKWTPADAPA